jgi:hypothetical protein
MMRSVRRVLEEAGGIVYFIDVDLYKVYYISGARMTVLLRGECHAM